LSYAISLIAETHDATTLISTIAEEMLVLQNVDVPHWFPSPEAIELCVDKWCFYWSMRQHGIPVPRTTLNGVDIPGPWVIKPRYGRGSRDVRYTSDRRVLELLVTDDDVIQTEATGREWTSDVLVGYDGQLLVCASRWRLETRGGISTKGETFISDDVTNACAQVATAVGLTGVCNIQGFCTNDGVVIVECNPRFSGGLPLSVYAGANLPDVYVKMIHDPFYVPEFKIRERASMTRYFSAVFSDV
jgi:carbamoyl-phosphate synthase large subunit